MTNYSKKELAAAVAEGSGLSASAAHDLIGQVFSAIVAAAEAGRTVNIPGFGRFAVKERAARTGRNPATGEPMEIAASSKLTFRPARKTA